MKREARAALLVGLFSLSRVLRGAPNLAEEAGQGRSLVATIWEQALDDHLHDLTAEEVESAVRDVLGRGVFFPAPADVIEGVRQIRRQRALRAAESALDDRVKALIAGSGDQATVEAERASALAAIREIQHGLVERLTVAGIRGLPSRSLAAMEAEVARLREADRRVRAGGVA